MNSKLVLTIVSQNGKPVANATPVMFDEQGGTIGRAADRTMVLDDPSRQIHREHADIACQDDQFHIRNTGRLAIRVNDRVILQGDECALVDRCMISIGGFVLRATRSATTSTDVHAGDVMATVPGRGHEPETLAVDTAAQRLWDAFLKGAGVDGKQHRIIQPDDQEALERQMLRMGTLLNACIAGYKELVHARNQTRFDLLAQAPTQMRVLPVGDENPIKRTTHANNIVAALISDPEPRVMNASTAITDIITELLAHTHATQAGIQDAATGLLDNFRPERVQAGISADTGLARFMPMVRKARLWDEFVNLNARLHESALEDFRQRFAEVYTAAHAKHPKKPPQQ